jgi:hypothetical protein
VLIPDEEITDVILEAGDGSLQLRYQCPLCTGVCTRALVRRFIKQRNVFAQNCLFQKYFVILACYFAMLQAILWRNKVAAKFSTAATFLFSQSLKSRG